jgi:hypothetical protein
MEGFFHGKTEDVRLVREPVAQGVDPGNKFELLLKAKLFDHSAGRDFKTEILKITAEIQMIGRVLFEEFVIELKKQKKAFAVVDVS